MKRNKGLKNIDFHIPGFKEFRSGYTIYNEKEKRGPIYFETISYLLQNWGNPVGMANGLSILVRGWNRFYANFDLDRLAKCVETNLQTIDSFRNRDIKSLSNADTDEIKSLFYQFLDALQRQSDNRKSPVSVAKALNPLAPYFFPLWDSNIAFAYNCIFWAENAASEYIKFCKKMKLMAKHLKTWVPKNDDRSLLKRIDEYNYSKYTRFWIS